MHVAEFYLQLNIQYDQNTQYTVCLMGETACEDLLGLSCLHSWMLCERMRVCSRCRLEGHGAERTFIEDLTVNTLDVGFYSCSISEDHTTVDTAGGRRNKSLRKSDLS